MGKWKAAGLVPSKPAEEEWVDPKVLRKQKKEEEKARKKKEKEDKRKAEKEAQKKALEDAVENAPEGSEERKAAEEALEEYRKKEEKKLFKKQMARVEELREKIRTLQEAGDPPEEEVASIQEEIDTILEFWAAKEEAEAAAMEPPPPEPPQGYKWGGKGSHVGGLLSEGALWDLGNLLLYAAREGDVREVREALRIAHESGADMLHLILNHRSHPEDRCALHMACESGNAQVLQLLLAYNPVIEVRARKGETPLAVATDLGHRACIQLLRNRGAQINRELYYDYDRCGEACRFGGCNEAAVGFGGLCTMHARHRNAVLINYQRAKTTAPL